jgi:hypothetical protein
MALEWIYSLENVDWEEVYRLYLAAPLGHEEPSDLKGGVLKQHVQVFCV